MPKPQIIVTQHSSDLMTVPVKLDAVKMQEGAKKCVFNKILFRYLYTSGM